MKRTKTLVALLAAAVIAVASLAFVACGEPKAELVDTYQAQARIKAFKVLPTSDYYVSETFTVELYSDGTYVCAVNITECLFKTAGVEFKDVNIMNPLAVSAFTRHGTYEITKDDTAGTFSLKLGKADRVTYSTNAGGGHYPLVPENKQMYFDSADAESTAAFDTEWYGKWEDLEKLVGAEVTLTGDSSTHMFDKGQVIFEYKTPMFKTLNGSDIY